MSKSAKNLIQYKVFIVCACTFILVCFSGCVLPGEATLDITGMDGLKFSVQLHESDVTPSMVQELEQIGVETKKLDNNHYLFSKQFSHLNTKTQIDNFLAKLSDIAPDLPDIDITDSFFSGTSFSGSNYISGTVLGLPHGFELTVVPDSGLYVGEQFFDSAHTIPASALEKGVRITSLFSSLTDVSILVLPQKNNHEILVEYNINKPGRAMPDMTQEDLQRMGFVRAEQTGGRFVLQREYTDKHEFNAMFNADLYRFFGVMSLLEANTRSGLSHGFSLSGIVFDSVFAPTVNMGIRFPSEGRDALSGETGLEHTWEYRADANAVVPAVLEIDVSSQSVNWATLFITMFILLSLSFVGVTLFILYKRSAALDSIKRKR